MSVHTSVIASISFAVAVSSASATGFDCTKVSSDAERTICSQPELADLDKKLAASYRQAAGLLGGKMKPYLQATQRAWLAERNRCGEDVACLRDSYQGRLEHLASPALKYEGVYVAAKALEVVAVWDGEMGLPATRGLVKLRLIDAETNSDELPRDRSNDLQVQLDVVTVDMPNVVTKRARVCQLIVRFSPTQAVLSSTDDCGEPLQDWVAQTGRVFRRDLSAVTTPRPAQQ